MSRVYMSYDPEQRLLLPPDLREWLPEEHLALFVSDVVEQLSYENLKVEIICSNVFVRSYCVFLSDVKLLMAQVASPFLI